MLNFYGIITSIAGHIAMAKVVDSHVISQGTSCNLRLPNKNHQLLLSLD